MLTPVVCHWVGGNCGVGERVRSLGGVSHEGPETAENESEPDPR